MFLGTYALIKMYIHMCLNEEFNKIKQKLCAVNEIVLSYYKSKKKKIYGIKK